MSRTPPPLLSPLQQQLQLYPYQQDCVNHAKNMNTIVNLPTGCGKTLIAARLIEYFLEKDPTKKIAFLVPTRPLVEQQAEYCKQNCLVVVATGTIGSQPPVVQQIVGQDQAGWRQSDWDACINKSHIILGTAALFQQAFVTDKYLDITRFSLLVFDECHNAVGNSPMAAVMRDCVAPLIKRGSGSVTTAPAAPRILGLTASFVNGSLRGIEKKRQDLEALLQSTIVCPNVQSKLVGNDRFRHVHWNRNANMEMHKEAISIHVQKAIDSVGPVKEITKVINRCIHVFEELGLYSLEFFIEKVIVQQVLEKAALLQDQQDDTGAAGRLAHRLLTGLPSLRSNLAMLMAHLKADFAVQQAASISLKLDRLIQILRQEFAAKGNDGYRGIVFVEQVALVSPLAKQLNDALNNIKCGAVAGTGYQNDKERQELLGKFKTGHLQILAATATLEEGIDVSQCEFVVRFTQVPTTKAHIQGAGRARHPDAIVYYFENNPVVERQKEASMETTARNQSLSLNTQEFHDAAVSMSTSVDQIHPYPFSSSTIPRAANAQDGSNNNNNNNTGEVNVFNCKKIFNEYCSITLGASITPSKDLYQYSNAPGQQKRLAKIRFPTPNGWRSLSEDDYRAFWDNVDLDKVFPAERTKKKSKSDKEEMTFVYMVTVQLRENGFLDCHNAPVTSLRFDTKRRCSLESDWSEAIRFKNVVIQSMRG